MEDVETESTASTAFRRDFSEMQQFLSDSAVRRVVSFGRTELNDFPDTHESLLIRLGSFEDHEAWELFAKLYHPILIRMSRNRGLQDADCHDLAQRILLSVALSIGRWKKKDPNTRFRHWLKKVTKNAFLNEITRRPRDLSEGGTTAMELLEKECLDPGSCNEFENEYRRELFRQSAQIVRAEFDSCRRIEEQ